ncbi:MAG: hypothetical protein M9962_08020 [Oligoflexia bacterium]|nr:hypothetical protein [Oligoflexia bacterium]
MRVCFSINKAWFLGLGILFISNMGFALSPPRCDVQYVVASDEDCEEIVNIKNFKELILKRLENQARRIGNALLNDQLTKEEKELLIDQQNTIREAYNDALEDKEITNEEKQLIVKMLKESSQSIFSARHDKEDFEKKLTSYTNRLKKGIKEGELTDEEAAEISREISGLEAKLKDMAADGLTYEEKLELNNEYKRVSQLIHVYRHNEKGKKKKKVDRTKDDIDEQQNKLSAELAQCYIKKQINDYEFELLQEELAAIKKLESKALSDAKLTKDEKTNINEALEKAKGNIKSFCEADYIMSQTPSNGNGSIGNNNGDQQVGIQINPPDAE